MWSRPEPSPPALATPGAALRAVPVPNGAARVIEDRPDLLLLGVPRRQPWWLRPLGLVTPLRQERRFQLDGLGLMVWRRLDGSTTVADLVDLLAGEEQLAWHEARLLTAQWLDRLAASGLVVVTAPEGPVPTPGLG